MTSKDAGSRPRQDDLMLEYLKMIDKRLGRIEGRFDQLEQKVNLIESKLDHHQITWTAKIVAGILAANAVISTLIFWLLSRMASGGFRIAEMGKDFFIS